MQKSRLLTLLAVALAPLSLFAKRTVQLGGVSFRARAESGAEFAVGQ